LVAKDYSHVYGLDYINTFSTVVKMIYARILVSLATPYHWSFHQMDTKNVFLNSILDEEVYMEQPPGFVA